MYLKHKESTLDYSRHFWQWKLYEKKREWLIKNSKLKRNHLQNKQKIANKGKKKLSKMHKLRGKMHLWHKSEFAQLISSETEGKWKCGNRMRLSGSKYSNVPDFFLSSSDPAQSLTCTPPPLLLLGVSSQQQRERSLSPLDLLSPASVAAASAGTPVTRLRRRECASESKAFEQWPSRDMGFFLLEKGCSKTLGPVPPPVQGASEFQFQILRAQCANEQPPNPYRAATRENKGRVKKLGSERVADSAKSWNKSNFYSSLLPDSKRA